MIIIKPLTITPAMVTANSTVNADPDWSSGTPYADKAKVSYNNRIWLSLQAANQGKVPGDAASVAWWSDAGPVNRYAMIDDKVGTVTTSDGSLSFTISGVALNSLALHNIKASEVSISVSNGGNVFFTKTINCWNSSTITNWTDYFFVEPDFKTDIAVTDIPLLYNSAVSVTLTNASGGGVAVGKVVLGRSVDIGRERRGLRREGIDYTSVIYEWDEVKIGPKRYVRKMAGNTVAENSKLDYLLNRLDAMASTPVTAIAGAGRYAGLIVYGFLTYAVDFELLSHSHVSFEVKGIL